MSETNRSKVPLAEIDALRTWVTLQAGRSDLSVRFEDGLIGPYTTSKEVVIPTPNSMMTEEDVIKLRGFVIHEMGHHIHGPEIFSICEKNGLVNGHPLPFILNLSEDSRTERASAMQYKGDAVALSASRRLLSEVNLNQLTTQIKRRGGVEALADDDARMLAVFIEETDSRSDWDVGSVIGMQDFIDLAKTCPKVPPYLDALRNIDYSERLRASESCPETFELAKEAYSVLWGKDADKEIEELKKAAAAKGKGEGEEQEGEGEGEDGEGPEGKGKEGGKPGDGKQSLTRMLAKALTMSAHDVKGKGSGMGLDYTKFDWTTNQVYIPIPSTNETKFDSVTSDTRSAGHYGTAIEQALAKCSPGFPEQVRRLIQVRSAVQYQGGYKSGKLNGRHLYRRNLPPEVVSEDYRQRLFRRKIENDTLDVAISLLVDCSGSMAGSKFVNAVTACSILSHAFDAVLRIPLEILGHTSSGRHGLEMAIVKPFSRPYKAGEVGSRFARFSNQMNGNADADALWFQYRRLIATKNKRKIMVVLSDGSPTDGASGSNPSYALKETVRQITDERRVEVYGIGIEDANVSRFYPKNIVIHDSSDLESKLLALLKTAILDK